MVRSAKWAQALTIAGLLAATPAAAEGLDLGGLVGGEGGIAGIGGGDGGIGGSLDVGAIGDGLGESLQGTDGPVGDTLGAVGDVTGEIGGNAGLDSALDTDGDGSLGAGGEAGGILSVGE